MVSLIRIKTMQTRHISNFIAIAVIRRTSLAVITKSGAVLADIFCRLRLQAQVHGVTTGSRLAVRQVVAGTVEEQP
ncbi:hypothetical protein D3C84_1113450 [compost metagenome]